jgi:hypothetical protein
MVGGVRLGNLRVVDLADAHLLLEPLDGVVGVHIDSIVDLHLQNQVGPALEVEAEMDALLNGVEEALARPVTRHANDPKDKEDQSSKDDG